MKTKRAYQTTDWITAATVMESGDVERDAARVMSLPTLKRRQHEIWRVGHLHGLEHETAVKRRVAQLWKEKENESENQKAA
jgi:hypothetical protein